MANVENTSTLGAVVVTNVPRNSGSLTVPEQAAALQVQRFYGLLPPYLTQGGLAPLVGQLWPRGSRA